jgi:hypothetical protein
VATRSDLVDQALGQKLGDHLAAGAADQIWGPFEGAVVALQCRRQQHELGIGKQAAGLPCRAAAWTSSPGASSLADSTLKFNGLKR